MSSGASGRYYLIITGVLLCTSSAPNAVRALVMIFANGFFSMGMWGSSRHLFVLIIGLSILISPVFSVAAGVCGIRYAERKEKAKILFVFGIILIVGTLIGLIMSIVSLYGISPSIFMFGGSFPLYISAFKLILPVFYLIGAIKNQFDL